MYTIAIILTLVCSFLADPFISDPTAIPNEQKVDKIEEVTVRRKQRQPIEGRCVRR